MRYRTIVADPPWDHSDGTGVQFGRGYIKEFMPEQGKTRTPYSSMNLDQMIELGSYVRWLAEDNAHLYLWTTNRYLRDSFDVIDAWGFKRAATLVWCKEPMGFSVGGTFPSSVEFVHFCRRGNLASTGRADKSWWTWPRRFGPPVPRGGKRQTMHSAKPEAFLDLVEQVSPGPYLEMFARRARLGWHVWGNEVDSTVEMPA